MDVPRGQSFRFVDCVSSVCLDMTNTPRLAAQCIGFYERPPRKRKRKERNRSDRGEKERADGKGEGTQSSDRGGRFYYVILLMHSVAGDPRASGLLSEKNVMSLRSENRP